MPVEYRKPIIQRPRAIRHGELWAPLNRSSIERADELAVTLSLILRRQLFGRLYARLQPDYFYDMPNPSGVLIDVSVQTDDLVYGSHQVGDIDILAIPYEGDQLILSRVLAIEVKTLRASFRKQGRSPNEFGRRQASALLDLGFPYVAIAHLIVSDHSPREAWRGISAYKVLDQFGNLGEPIETQADLMPIDLMTRAYGRLEMHTKDIPVGLCCCYVGQYDNYVPFTSIADSTWLPRGRLSPRNLKTRLELLDGVYAYFCRKYSDFLDNPRFDP